MKTKKIQGNTIPNFDTGKLIGKIVKEQNLTTAKLARMMGRGHTTMKNIQKSTSHQAYIIYQLSCILNHNFFADLASWLPDEIPGKEALSDKRVAELEQQVLELKAENKVLYKMLAAKGA